MNIVVKTLLTCGLNYLASYILKSQWLHFKILGFLEEKAKETNNRLDDWGVLVFRYVLEKYHGIRPMNDSDKLIATAVMTAIANNSSYPGFTFDDLTDVKKKLGLVAEK